MQYKDQKEYIARVESKLNIPVFEGNNYIELEWSLVWKKGYQYRAAKPDDEIDESNSRVKIKVKGYYVGNESDYSRRSISIKKLTIPALQHKIDEVAEALRTRIDTVKAEKREQQQWKTAMEKFFADKNVDKLGLYWASRKFVFWKDMDKYEGFSILHKDGSLDVLIKSIRYSEGVDIKDVFDGFKNETK